MASRIYPYAVIGHRGAPQLVPPGNTIASLQRAVDVGAQMVEVDVRATRDEVLVIDHEAVRSLGGLETPLRERVYDVWREHAAETGAPLPTLTEVFSFVQKTGVGLMLDFKEPGTEGLLARAIRRAGIPLSRLVVAGANQTSRQIFRALDPSIPLSLTLSSDDDPAIDAKLLSEIDTDAVTWHHKLITPPITKVLQLRRIVVYAWTVNLTEDMRRMRDVCKVDGIITDSPDLLKSL